MPLFFKVQFKSVNNFLCKFKVFYSVNRQLGKNDHGSGAIQILCGTYHNS